MAGGVQRVLDLADRHLTEVEDARGEHRIRTRVDRVVAFLERHDVDVLAMQETKCKDEQFPMARFEEAGYEVAHHGLNQWNGVAIASRVGLEDISIGFEDMPGFGDPIAAEARAIGVPLTEVIAHLDAARDAGPPVVGDAAATP